MKLRSLYIALTVFALLALGGSGVLIFKLDHLFLPQQMVRSEKQNRATKTVIKLGQDVGQLVAATEQKTLRKLQESINERLRTISQVTSTNHSLVQFKQTVNAYVSQTLHVQKLLSESQREEAQLQNTYRALRRVLAKEASSHLNVEKVDMLAGLKAQLADWGKTVGFFKTLRENLGVVATDRKRMGLIENYLKIDNKLTQLHKRETFPQNKINEVRELINDLENKGLQNVPASSLKLMTRGFDQYVKDYKNWLATKNKLQKAKKKTSLQQKQLPRQLHNEIVPVWESYLVRLNREQSLADERKRRMLLEILLGAGGFFIFLMLIIFLKIFGPLKKLRQRSKEISEGDFHKRFSKIPKNELGELMNSFNTMATKLDELMNELKEKGEERLELQQNLAKSRQWSALGEMAGKLSHELKNPLEILTLSLADAQSLTKDGETQKALKELGRMEYGLERLKQLTMRLNMSRSQEEFRPISGHQLLQNLLELYEGRLKKGQIELEVNLEASRDKITGAHLDLQGAISNLVDNAIEANERQGQKQLKIWSENSDEFFSVYIANPCTPLTEKERLFRPTNSSKERGQGLGLSIVKDIAKGHGGDIHYEHREGFNQFRFSVPLAD